MGDALVVVCVGGTSSEWNAYRPSDGNLRCWTLGLTSSVALGMALGLPHRRVIALDGDGSLLMNLCGLPTIMRKKPKNLIHVVFDNGVYESSGGTKTATAAGVDFVTVAKGVGIKNAFGANRWTNSRACSAMRLLVGSTRLSAPPLNREGVKCRPGRGPMWRTNIAFPATLKRPKEFPFSKLEFPGSWKKT